MIKYLYMLYLLILILIFTVFTKWSWVLEFSILNLGSMNMGFSLMLEEFSSAFVFTVLTIFTMVYMYSFSYLSEEVYLKRFLMILSLFASSMCILISSSNLFTSLVGWDGLGVTSLFLILFYYSKSAFKASTLTFLMNRVGDCFFILALAQIFLLSENLIIYSCSYFSSNIVFLLIMTSITKSAQIPFSTWLPAAMEAPTPVSALVHSSTLVTAGVYLLFRYNVMWISSGLKDILMILSVSTCFMAALSALVENDLKKLIALSTLSQLGFIMFSFSLGMLIQGFLHMLMHAFFKALLFMCAGYIIHSSKGSQSILDFSSSGNQNPMLVSVMNCSLMSMSGMPFLAGFYSKDLIVDFLKSSQWAVLTMTLLILSFLCTIMYSVRVIWYISNSSNNWHCMSDNDSEMFKPMFPLAFMASLGGSTVTWLMVDQEVYLDSSKMLMLGFLVFAGSSYWMFNMVGTNNFLEKKWNLSIFNSMLSNLFFQSSLIYKGSSDLLGIPEIMNKRMKFMFTKMSQKVSKTMILYTGSVEFMMFLVLMMILL